MSGYNLILKVKRLEDTLHRLGMRWGQHQSGWHGVEQEDMLSVYPRDEELPVYARDACLFTGTLNQLETWIIGIEWARSYDMVTRVSDEKKRARREQDRRNENLVRRLKDEKIEELA
jgi:hypothetical protein